MAITDRYGLPITTESPTAAARFQHGMDMLLAYGPGAAEAFASATETDPRLAVAHAGQALVAVVQGDAATARAATEKARDVVAGSEYAEDAALVAWAVSFVDVRGRRCRHEWARSRQRA